MNSQEDLPYWNIVTIASVVPWLQFFLALVCISPLVVFIYYSFSMANEQTEFDGKNDVTWHEGWITKNRATQINLVNFANQVNLEVVIIDEGIEHLMILQFDAYHMNMQ